MQVSRWLIPSVVFGNREAGGQSRWWRRWRWSQPRRSWRMCQTLWDGRSRRLGIDSNHGIVLACGTTGVVARIQTLGYYLSREVRCKRQVTAPNFLPAPANQPRGPRATGERLRVTEREPFRVQSPDTLKLAASCLHDPSLSKHPER